MNYKILILSVIVITALVISTLIFLQIQNDPEKEYESIKNIPVDKKIIANQNELIIFDDYDKNNYRRLNIEPHDLIINLTNSDIVTFENQASFTVKIFVNKESSRIDTNNPSADTIIFEDIKPNTKKTLQINHTRYYDFVVQDSREGESGTIVALSEKTNDLPVPIKAKMAQSMIFGNVPNVVGVGSGGGPGTGITVSILESELNKHENATSYYYNLIKNKIPFDVPIKIEYMSPITLN